MALVLVYLVGADCYNGILLISGLMQVSISE